MKKQLILLCGLLGLSLPACRQPDPKFLPTEPLTLVDTGITAVVDQDFIVVLPSLGSKPSYKWVLQDGYDTKLLRFDGERDAASEFPEGAPPTYAPNRVFMFKAIATGQTELLFAQKPVNSGIPEIDATRRHQVTIQAP